MDKLIGDMRIPWRMNVSMFLFQNSLGFPQARAHAHVAAEAIGYRHASRSINNRTLGV